jgi:transcription antitermination protein NusB
MNTSSKSPEAKPSGQPANPARAAKQREFASKTAARAARTRARELAIQALYQHLVGQQSLDEIDEFTRGLQGFHKADSAHYDALFRGCAESAEQLDTLIAPHLDRPWAEISPIEHAVMWLGTYELQHCPDVPWRVVINEYIEQAKAFGGTDGHKYVNSILDKLAPKLRAAEVAADTAPGKK